MPQGSELVKVLAAPANFPDVLLCRGRYQIKPPLPFTPGVELCEIVAVGAGAGRAVVGDRVVGTDPARRRGLIRPLIGERLALTDMAPGVGRLGDGSTVGRLVFQS